MIWHSETVAAVTEQLDSDTRCGLTAEQAAARLEQYGQNKLDEKPPRSFMARFLEQMKDTMVIILLIAALISFAMAAYTQFFGQGNGDWIEPIVILAIVLVNALLGVLQEQKAEASLEALKSMSAPSAKVTRDGVRQIISALDLVPGDIVEFEAGDMIPADARLLTASNLRCDESALTGEAVPAEKNPNAAVIDSAPLGDRLNSVYAGCAVSYGNGRAVVTETGMRTEMGKIAAMLANAKEQATPLQERLAKLGRQLGVIVLAICAIVFAVGLLGMIPRLGTTEISEILELFMTAVSLAVAAIPEGLPAIVTIVLAIGVQRMVKKHAIIRRLPAVESLGSASVICSDKTGTLTQNRMTLQRLFNGRTTVDLTAGDVDAGALLLIRMATLCTYGSVRMENGREVAIGDPTETSIISYALKNGMDREKLMDEHPRLGEIPFDSDRKLMTVVHMVEGQYLVIVKGAPDVLLDCCDRVDKEAVAAANREMAEQALRVLAVGYKVIDTVPAHCLPEEMECGLTFACLIGMIDPPREEVMLSIRDCQTAGIRTVMITGDHVITAVAIARELGILREGDEALSGTELAALSDEELFQNIRRYSVYARVSPTDKLRIVHAWQRAGEIVAMTGDGVNDAPALKTADIGCAMGITGTDVAKGAADMVLTDDNFSTIVGAVKEGRGIYDNIRKAVQFLLSCNLGEVLTVFLSMLVWREAPLMPVQLLWVNLVTDGLPALALGMEPPEHGIMKRRPRKAGEGLFAHGLGWSVAWQGTMIGLITLAAYVIGSRFLSPAATGHFWSTLLLDGSRLPASSILLGETMAFTTLAISQLVHAVNVRSSLPLLKAGLLSNLYMIGAFFASLVLMLVVLLIPGLQAVFHVGAMGRTAWLICIGLVLVPFVVMEITKWARVLFRRWTR